MMILTGDGEKLLNTEKFAGFQLMGSDLVAITDFTDETFSSAVVIVKAPSEEHAEKYFGMLKQILAENTLNFQTVLVEDLAKMGEPEFSIQKYDKER